MLGRFVWMDGELELESSRRVHHKDIAKRMIAEGRAFWPSKALVAGDYSLSDFHPELPVSVFIDWEGGDPELAPSIDELAVMIKDELTTEKTSASSDYWAPYAAKVVSFSPLKLKAAVGTKRTFHRELAEQLGYDPQDEFVFGFTNGERVQDKWGSDINHPQLQEAVAQAYKERFPNPLSDSAWKSASWIEKEFPIPEPYASQPWNQSKWLEKEDENHSWYGDDVKPGMYSMPLYVFPDGRWKLGDAGQSHAYEETQEWLAKEMGIDQDENWDYAGSMSVNRDSYDLSWPEKVPYNEEVAQQIIHEGLEKANDYRKYFYDQRQHETKTAKWPDIMEKAQRYRQDGRVKLLTNTPTHVVSQVSSETQPGNVYQTEIWMDEPDKGTITQWSCECQWGDFSWGRTRQWKKYEGRPCVHTLATYWESVTQPKSQEEPGAQQQLLNPADYIKQTLPGQQQQPQQQQQSPVVVQPQDVSQQLTLPGTLSSWRRTTSFSNGDYVKTNEPLDGTDDRGQSYIVPRNMVGEVIWSDDTEAIVIFSIEAGPLGPHNVRVTADPDSFRLVPRLKGTAPRRRR